MPTNYKWRLSHFAFHECHDSRQDGTATAATDKRCHKAHCIAAREHAQDLTTANAANKTCNRVTDCAN